MSSYSKKPTPNDGPGLQPPSYAELTAAKAREYGFVPEVLRPTTTSYPPRAPYPTSSQDTGQMPMPMAMPVRVPVPVPLPLPVPVPVIKTNSPNFTEESVTSRWQPSRIPALPHRNYQRMGTTGGQCARTPRVRRDRKLVSQKLEPDPAPSMYCVFIAIMLLIGFFTVLGLILRSRSR